MLSDIIKNTGSALCTGIIGGADGPTVTVIAVTSNPMDWVLIAILIAVIIGLVALFAVKLKRRKGKKYRHKKTSDTETSEPEIKD